MLIAKGKYLNHLRNEVEHLRSSNKILTDAPIDNNGKGEQFSPTDLLSVSLATCMVTIMGIWAEKNEVSMGKVSYAIEKEMNAAPRKVNRIKVDITIEGSMTDQHKVAIERAARNCPVALSLSESLVQEIQFIYA